RGTQPDARGYWARDAAVGRRALAGLGGAPRGSGRLRERARGDVRRRARSDRTDGRDARGPHRADPYQARACQRRSGRRPPVARTCALVVPGMFHTPPRLRHLVRPLRPFPRGFGETVLAGAAVVDGVVRPRRLRRAYAWAAAQPGRGIPAWRLALA